MKNKIFKLIIYILIFFSKLHTSALGALGRRFESCRPTQSKPSHTSELPRLAFLLQKYDHSKCGEIVVKFD